jgi:exosortase D (VPLPA-CTERM-specific)
VWFIRSIGGVVYLEGNVIDMGGVQLLVAEACSGLRYLFPLMSLGAIIGYMLHAPLWIRWTVFLVTIPITIILNSFRIGLTGVMAELWGMSHTEGFLHFFEGWVVFVAATLILISVVWLLLRFAMPGKSIRDVLLFDSGAVSTRLNTLPISEIPGSANRVALAWWLAIMMIVTTASATALAMRAEIPPVREAFGNFPVKLGDWSSREYRLPPETESVAGASEYYYGDFKSSTDGSVNLYIAYYKTQLQGQIPHSPKVCIPGGGWKIESIQTVSLKNRNGVPFEANRLVIAKGDQKQLTYYWLKQGRMMYSQELRARLDLLRSSIMENRTDGALVRIVTDIDAKNSVQVADDRLVKFSQLLLGVLPEYVPD